MKFKPWQNSVDGKWYVANSNRSKFFRATACDSIKEAITQCLKMEERDLIDKVIKHERLSRRAFDELEKKYPHKYGDGSSQASYGDLVC